MPEENPWTDYILQESPEAAYYSAAPFGSGASAGSPWGGGYSPMSQQYWSGQFGNIRNQYLGQVGRSLRAGQEPSMSFTDYLEQYPWTQRYTALGPSMRPGGRSSSRFAPSARYMY